MNCYGCRVEVSAQDHRKHMRILDAIVEAEVPGCDDLFVHCVGPKDEFDLKGNVAVCDKCLIEELADNLEDPYEGIHPDDLKRDFWRPAHLLDE